MINTEGSSSEEEWYLLWSTVKVNGCSVFNLCWIYQINEAVYLLVYLSACEGVQSRKGRIILNWNNKFSDAGAMNLPCVSLLFNWNWHISFREHTEMHPEALQQLFVQKANICLSHAHYDVNDRDRDMPHLFKLPQLLMKYSNCLTILNSAWVVPLSS